MSSAAIDDEGNDVHQLKAPLVSGADSLVRKPVHQCICRKLELIRSVVSESEQASERASKCTARSAHRDFQLLLP